MSVLGDTPLGPLGQHEGIGANKIKDKQKQKTYFILKPGCNLLLCTGRVSGLWGIWCNPEPRMKGWTPFYEAAAPYDLPSG